MNGLEQKNYANQECKSDIIAFMSYPDETPLDSCELRRQLILISSRRDILSHNRATSIQHSAITQPKGDTCITDNRKTYYKYL